MPAVYVFLVKNMVYTCQNERPKPKPSIHGPAACLLSWARLRAASCAPGPSPPSVEGPLPHCVTERMEEKVKESELNKAEEEKELGTACDQAIGMASSQTEEEQKTEKRVRRPNVRLSGPEWRA
jgi:hypothetical protein